MKNGMDCSFQFNVNRHCDDSGELSDNDWEHLDNFFKKSKDPVKLSILGNLTTSAISNLKDGEAVLHEGRVCVVIDKNLVFFKAVNLETLTERMC